MRAVVAAVALTLLAILAPPAAAERPATTRTLDRAEATPLLLRPATQRTDLLTWRRVGYPRSATVWTNGAWTLASSDRADRWVELTGPGLHRRWDVPDRGAYVDSVFLDDHWAVFGVRRSAPGSSEPLYTVVDLVTGDVRRLDRHLSGRALYAESYLAGRLLVTTRRSGQWCLGYVDLATRQVSAGPCPAADTHFTGAQLTDDGLSAGQVEPAEDDGDQDFSCTALLDLSGDLPARFPRTGRCWVREDAMLAPGGTFWSERIRPGLLSKSRFRAVSGDTLYRLGRGAGGSGAWCHGATYFVSGPGSGVVRWDGSGVVTTVYDGPWPARHLRCGGDHLTVTVEAGSATRQLAASLR